MPHRCCHLPNKIENSMRMPDIPLWYSPKSLLYNGLGDVPPNCSFHWEILAPETHRHTDHKTSEWSQIYEAASMNVLGKPESVGSWRYRKVKNLIDGSLGPCRFTTRTALDSALLLTIVRALQMILLYCIIFRSVCQLCGAHGRHCWPTHKHTQRDQPRHSVCSNRPHRHACNAAY